MSSNEWGFVTIPTQTDPEQRAISRLRIASEMSLKYYGTPLVVTTSGGKDSSVCVELARRAGIPHEVQHNHTTADAPETVRFVRQEFARIENSGISCKINYPYYKGKRTSMWNLIPQKLMPPTRLHRYCCGVLKEYGGVKRFVATGIRWDESPKRAHERGIFETYTWSKKDKLVKKNDDSDVDVFSTCKPAAKHMVNPIVDWTEAQVWDFLSDAKIPVNPLYQCGMRRVGCILCPLACKKKRYEEMRRWPAYEKLYTKTFDRMLVNRELHGKPTTWQNGRDVFRWWMEEDVLPGQLSWEDFT